MRKLLSFILILVLLLCLFSGCQQDEVELVDDRELSVFALTCSEELQDAIETAYYEWQVEKHGDNADKHIYEWIWTDFPSGVHGGYRYYGTFDDCVVWCATGIATVITEYTVADSTFYYHNSASFFAYCKGKHYKLREAYEKNLISKEDVAIAAQRHAEYNEYEHNLWKSDG